MRAAVHDRYGTPDVVRVADLDPPTVAAGQVLVRVRAAALNPLDWHAVTGTPYLVRLGGGLRRPKQARLGVDYSGTVEAVGEGVTRFRPGDEVFGGRTGALAELISAAETGTIAHKPARLTFEQAAAVPVAGITALQALRDHGRLQSGQHVLVNGAAGGVGSFAIQLAKAQGARVTAVCRTANASLVRSLGADDVIDYTRDDFTRHPARYHVIIDNAGGHAWRAYRRVMHPTARLVVVGGPKTNPLLGPLSHAVRMRLASTFAPQRAVFFIAKLTQPDLEHLRDLLDAGAVTPHVEQTHRLEDIAGALRHMGSGHTRGKLVITLDSPRRP